MSDLFNVGMEPQKFKNGLEMGVTIGVDTEKSVKNIQLIVIMCMRLSNKISLLDLTNRTQLKKVND